MLKGKHSCVFSCPCRNKPSKREPARTQTSELTLQENGLKFVQEEERETLKNTYGVFVTSTAYAPPRCSGSDHGRNGLKDAFRGSMDHQKCPLVIVNEQLCHSENNLSLGRDKVD